MDNGISIIGLVAWTIMMMIIAGFISSSIWKDDLVQRGLALYCPNTGKFAFNDECPK